MKWNEVLRILGPAVLSVVPGAQPFIPLVIAGMTLAEETGKGGKEKKEIALEAVVLGAQTANTIAKREVVNAVEAERTALDTIDAIVSIVNIAKKATDKPEVN